MKIEKSLIIPTLWYANDYLFKMLPLYEKSKYIKEIIIIDNNPEETPDLSEFSKIKLLRKGENIYVTASWNWGAKEAKYGVMIANDDILWEDIDYLIEETSKTDYDLIGASRCRYPFKKMIIDPIDKWGNTSNYGSLMFIKDYKPIPEEMKVWWGDNWLYDNAKNPAIFKGIKYENARISIGRLFPDIGEILENDKLEYRKIKEENADK